MSTYFVCLVAVCLLSVLHVGFVWGVLCVFVCVCVFVCSRLVVAVD